LRLGTHQDNARDKVERRRNPKCEDHYKSKLTAASACEIVNEFRSGIPQDEIAARFGVGQSAISYVVTGRHWGEVTGIQFKPSKNKLTSDGVKEILQLRSIGVTQQAIADQFGVTRECISSVCQGKTWSHITGLSSRSTYQFVPSQENNRDNPY
jgi:predicted XRE-type DNA-binding protein